MSITSELFTTEFLATSTSQYGKACKAWVALLLEACGDLTLAETLNDTNANYGAILTIRNSILAFKIYNSSGTSFYQEVGSYIGGTFTRIGYASQSNVFTIPTMTGATSTPRAMTLSIRKLTVNGKGVFLRTDNASAFRMAYFPLEEAGRNLLAALVPSGTNTTSSFITSTIIAVTDGSVTGDLSVSYFAGTTTNLPSGVKLLYPSRLYSPAIETILPNVSGSPLYKTTGIPGIMEQFTIGERSFVSLGDAYCLESL